MNCLVTGGAGFIGSHVVDLLLKEGHNVVVVDDFSTGKLENINRVLLSNTHSQGWLVTCDISRVEDLYEYVFKMWKPEVVFHLAAWARVQRSIDYTLGTHRVNVNGTLNLLEMCRKYGVKNFIYSSSSSVYGNQDVAIMEEKMQCKPLHPYGLQKYIGELYGERYAKLFGLNFIALRYFNVYGPRQLTEGDYALVIGKFMRQIRDGEKMTIYGDGEQTRAYTYVSDVAQANLAVMNTLRVGYTGNFEVYNVGTGVETSVNKISKLLSGEVDHIIPNPRGDFEEKRKAANFDKIKRDIGWEPSVTIEEGIQKLKEYETNLAKNLG